MPKPFSVTIYFDTHDAATNAIRALREAKAIDHSCRPVVAEEMHQDDEEDDVAPIVVTVCFVGVLLLLAAAVWCKYLSLGI